MYCYINNGELCILSVANGVDVHAEAARLGIDTLFEIDTLPKSRNWRNAWRLMNGQIVIDLEKAKEVQKQLAVSKAVERAEKDLSGKPKQTALDALEAEIEAIDWNAPATLDELYNTWPASIELRGVERVYEL